MRANGIRWDRFRAVADIAPFGIFETDAEGSAVYINPWLCVLVGESQETALADGWATAVHPEDLPSIEAAWASATERQSTFRQEHRLVRPDGLTVWVVTSARPIRDDRGRVTGYLGCITDVTGERLSRSALDASQARFHEARKRDRLALVEVSPDPTMVVANDAIVFANAAALALFGARRLADLVADGRVESRFPADAAPQPPAPTTADSLERMAQGPAKLHYRRLDGTVGVAEVVARRFRHERQPAVLLVARDMTDRARLEEQLRQAQKMEAVGRLAGGVAHDFNNLLVAISGYAELLLGATTPGDEVHEYAGEILRAADRASALTGRLLTFSRQQPPSTAVVDLNDVIRGLDPMLRQITDERTHLAVRLAPGPAFVRLDPGLIEQAVLNLLINARDAMRRKGTIRVTIGFRDVDEAGRGAQPGVAGGRYATLSVADTGEGIAPEHLPHLFEPFFTTKPLSKGTGLGLSIVYSVVRGAGGSILVDSTPGRGTRFDLLFPLASAPGDLARPATVRADETIDGSEELLVVEDEPAIRTLVEKMLSRRGYRVRLAASAEEAMELVPRIPRPDLLVTDVLLPAMSGPQLAEDLRTRMPGLGVLFISGYSADRLAPDGDFGPGTGFLAKPFSSDELARSVRRLLEESLAVGA